ncbi:tumor necrosis factor receptor superfamily member 19-like [Nerophis lumbriciformis]|uniref:tumor necrosis factor receptor superfamily member 19-like n=1 Tax=Nerophis lumbriciformis TaxID=546530 RepID=UPI002ADF0003|nr:tumor necrosis factor receptor superfamily member 19-like [Nerophis lumbriciformis]
MVQMNQLSLVITAQVIFSTLIPATGEEESRECREQEYKDQFGNCKACKQCNAGQELSKECGFGYGEDARCVPCRTSRFKEDRSLQKCKPCLDCGVINRFQKSNCSTTSNAVCGECLPGFYRKTKLSGFKDMECIPCGDSPPLYEPHCSGRVNLVPLPSVVTSPRDIALAAVICSALATVLLALLVLCVIYCKRQLLEKKHSAASLRTQDCPSGGAELSYLDPRWLHDIPQRPCCQCHLGQGHTCGSVHLIPSLCSKDSLDQAPFESDTGLSDRNLEQEDELGPLQPGEHSTSAEAVSEAFRLEPEPAGGAAVECGESDETEAREKQPLSP